MNWITKFIKPKLKTLLKKQPKPDEAGLWTTCVCQQLIYKEDLHNNFFVCPKCETHQKISCRDRFNIFRRFYNFIGRIKQVIQAHLWRQIKMKATFANVRVCNQIRKV